MNPVWSVLVCCHNSEARLESTLKAISSQTLAQRGIRFEVVIVDNASTDRTAEIATSHAFPPSVNARLVHEPRPGLSFARRAAVANSSGNYVCFLDDDNDADPNYLEVAGQILDANPGVAFCGGKSSWPATTESRLPLLARFFSKSIAVGAQRDESDVYIEPGGFLWGAGLCLRGAPLRELYALGFDALLTGRLGKRVLSGEDGELTILLQLFGGRGYYTDRLRLVHRVDHSRFNLSYFSRLFVGMGMALPVLKAYRETLALECAPAATHSTAAKEHSRRRSRFAALRLPEAVAVVGLYGWLAFCFYSGAVRTRLSPLPHQAQVQAQRIALALRSGR